MDKSAEIDNVGGLTNGQVHAALLACEAVNAALIRIIDSYVSHEGYESREKRLVPIRRKLRLALTQSIRQGCANNGGPQCNKTDLEAALRSAMASTERAIGFHTQ